MDATIATPAMIWLPATATLCLTVAAPVFAGSVPADFMLVAEYASAPSITEQLRGSERWMSWTVTITAEGKAVQEVRLAGGGDRVARKALTLSPSTLREIRAAQFQRLADRYLRGRIRGRHAGDQRDDGSAASRGHRSRPGRVQGPA